MAGPRGSKKPAVTAVAEFDARPFFEKALAFAARQKMIGREQMDAMRIDGAKGMVQIADFFGTSYLRANLDEARARIVTLASLYLENYSGGELAKAARSLRDFSFLSHSRGGSELLKKLHAMPKSTLFGDEGTEPIREFLDEWSLYGTRIMAKYRETLAEREETGRYLAAAAWYADRMGIARSTLSISSADERYLTSAEGVIRTSILLRLGKDPSCPNRADFARLVMGLRAKPISARARKALLTKPADLPPEYAPIEDAIVQHILKFDLPKIEDQAIALDELLNVLESRYFLRATGIDEISEYDAMVSAEWHKIMKGKSEPDARLTVFFCLAAGAPPKPTLTETAARALVRRVREAGLDSASVLKFINDNAPFDLRESLVELWEEEFVPDAEVALFDVRDEKLSVAMKFLKENLRITTPAAKKKA